MLELPGLELGSSAVISSDGVYRYALTRVWQPVAHRAVWIMLNPSTADATTDDPTIRRCVAFSKLWGCGGLTVVNLYAWRATDPRELLTAAQDIVGPDNDQTITMALASSAVVVAAWGVHGKPERVREVTALAALTGRRLRCLGTTKDGHPRHPLYVRGDKTLDDYEGTEVARG